MKYGEAWLNGWRNSFNFRGVSSRFEFWSFISGNSAICLLPMVCWWLATAMQHDYGIFIFYAMPLSVILMSLSAVPVPALGFRRMHDIGRSGWWFTGILIPYVGIIVFLMCFLPSRTDSSH